MPRYWLAMLLAVVSFAVHAQTLDDSRQNEIAKLPWVTGGMHKLAASHSSLSIPIDHMIVVGPNAARFEELIGNHHLAGIEAVTVNSHDEQVIFENVEEGHVSIEDWKDIDSNEMLNQI